MKQEINLPMNLEYNWQDLARDFTVVGVDEVGRGCLAGPVYAAAVILDLNQDFSAYTDSKKLTAKRREVLSSHIFRHHQAAIGVASVDEITEFNIFQASMLAMRRAISSLQLSGRIHVLVDGHLKIPELKYDQTPLVKGDLRASPIAAASIVAKVARDRLMAETAKVFPHYGFEKHKGYCTKEHKEAIKVWGPCKLHRPSFSGVKEYLGAGV